MPKTSAKGTPELGWGGSMEWTNVSLEPALQAAN